MTMNNQNRNEIDGRPPKNNNTSTIVGAIIIFLGFALLMKQMNLGNIIPGWLFGWETILIIIGLVIGVNSKFEKKSSIVLIAIGSVFFLRNELGLHIGRFIIPAAAIILGLYLLNRNKTRPQLPPTPPKDDEFDWDKRVDSTFTGTPSSESSTKTSSDSYAQSPNAERKMTGFKNYLPEFENYLKVDNFFSDTKKIILSKNFLGGNITSIFGSTNLNFLQADLNQPVVIDTFQLFGSTKIIVPMHWRVHTNVSSIFGDVDDRRPHFEITTDSNKKIYITGTSIFGSITIKNS